jgi:hypothetical protein
VAKLKYVPMSKSLDILKEGHLLRRDNKIKAYEE